MASPYGVFLVSLASRNMAELTVNVPPTSAAHSIEAHNREYIPKPPVFSSKEDERSFLKFRLAQAFGEITRL